MSKSKQEVTSELSRELSLFHVTMMGLGMMIGAGIFLGVGNSIHQAGPGGVLLTFALNGVLAIFTAMSYAELSSAIPRAGGAYNFARIGFGRGTSFIAGWMEWFASSVAGSLYSITFAIYVLRYFEQLGLLSWMGHYFFIGEKILAMIIAIFFLYINYRGASETGKIGAFFTFGQILFLIIIGFVGVLVAIKDPSRLQNFNPFLPNGWSKLLVTMGFTYVAFEGFEVIAQAGDETINPKKNLPKAILYSVIIVTFIYVFVAFATVIAAKSSLLKIDGNPWTGEPWQWIGYFKEKGFGESLALLMPMGNFLLTLAVIFASTSALNATIYSATRASYALGRDRMLPKFLSNISKKRKTPANALLFTGIIVIIVATFLPTKDVASSASIMFLFLFFLVNVCVIKIRRDMADELEYGYIMPLFPIFPILAIILQAILAVWLLHMSLLAWIIAPLWIIIGFIIYHSYSKSRAIATEDEIFVFEEEKATKGDGAYHIMVAVSNPNNALSLVSNTYKLCEAKKAKVELLHMVPVPKQVPLTDANNYMLEGKEAMVETMLYLAPLFPVSTTFRYCRNIARGIVSAIKQKNIDMLIIGWHGKAKTHWYNLGSTIDPIIERSICNVVIMKNCQNKDFKNILVPLAGGPNSALALEIASILINKKIGKIVAFSVNTQKKQFDIDKFIQKNKKRLHVPVDRITKKTITSRHVLDSILEEAKNYDLIILGNTQQPLIFQMAGTNIPETFAKKCTKPVIMVRATSGIKSWLGRII